MIYLVLDIFGLNNLDEQTFFSPVSWLLMGFDDGLATSFLQWIFLGVWWMLMILVHV